MKSTFPPVRLATWASSIWKVYSLRDKEKAWLKSVGLCDAVFPTRRDAVSHLKEALKARVT